MSDQTLTDTVAQLTAQVAAMQAELSGQRQEIARLNGKLPVIEPATQPTATLDPAVATLTANPSRRRMLRRLAGGMLAGLAVGSVATSLPPPVEAKFVAAKGFGAIVMPPGSTITGTVPAGTVYGLYATADATSDLTGYGANTKVGVMGLLTSTESGSTYYGVFGQAKNYGVYGQGSSYGVYGKGDTFGVAGAGYYGVHGTGTTYWVYGYGTTGVYGHSFNGVGVKADSGPGVPFRIVSGNPPTSPGRVKGDMYVDTSGNLHIHNGSEWRLVTTTAG